MNSRIVIAKIGADYYFLIYTGGSDAFTMMVEKGTAIGLAEHLGIEIQSAG